MSVPTPASPRNMAQALDQKLMERTPLFDRESPYELHLSLAVDDIPQHTLAETSGTKEGGQSNIMRAMQLVRTGCVEAMSDGKRWRVTGATGVYIARAQSCSCPQGRHKDWCYHRMAVHLYIAWCARLVKANVPLVEFLVSNGTPPVSLAQPGMRDGMRDGMVAALDTLVARGLEKLPECRVQFEVARAIVEAGGVTLIDDELASVWITRERFDDPVEVREHCPLEECADAPRNWCEHRLASALMRRMVEELAKDRVDERDEEPPTPERAEPETTDSLPLQVQPEQVEPQPPTPAHAEPVEPELQPPVLTHEEPLEPSPPTPAREERPSEPVHGMLLEPLALRSIAAIMADLSKPLPKECVAVRKQKGMDIPYLHHFIVLDVLDTYAPGWHGQVVKTELLGSRCVVTYRLSIPCAEGIVVREDIGQEDDWDESEGARFGDPGSNAKAMAFKRAAMQFGLGRWLYSHDATRPALLQHLKQEKVALWERLADRVDALGWKREDVVAWLRAETGSLTNNDVPISAVRALLAQLSKEESDGAYRM